MNVRFRGVVAKFQKRAFKGILRSKVVGSMDYLKLFKTRSGVEALIKSRLMKKINDTLHDEDIERGRKMGAEKITLGTSFADHSRMKINLYKKKALFTSKMGSNEKLQYLRRSLGLNASLYTNYLYRGGAPKPVAKRRTKRMELATHFLEVNYATLKAVIFYLPKPLRFGGRSGDLWTGEF